MCVYIWNGYIQESKFIEFVFIIPIALGLIFKGEVSGYLHLITVYNVYTGR